MRKIQCCIIIYCQVVLVFPCDEDQRACTSDPSRCVPLDWLCDGKRDCLDGSDESAPECHEHKASSACFGDQPECVYLGVRRCIRHDWVCDGNWDCDNGEDEQNCTANLFSPPSGEARVLIGLNPLGSHPRARPRNSTNAHAGRGEKTKSRLKTTRPQQPTAVPLGTDPMETTTKNTDVTKRDCLPFEFKCTSGECLIRDLLCDTHKDCPDGSDETDEHCSTPPKIIVEPMPIPEAEPSTAAEQPHTYATLISQITEATITHNSDNKDRVSDKPIIEDASNNELELFSAANTAIQSHEKLQNLTNVHAKTETTERKTTPSEAKKPTASKDMQALQEIVQPITPSTRKHSRINKPGATRTQQGSASEFLQGLNIAAKTGEQNIIPKVKTNGDQYTLALTPDPQSLEEILLENQNTVQSTANSSKQLVDDFEKSQRNDGQKTLSDLVVPAGAHNANGNTMGRLHDMEGTVSRSEVRSEEPEDSQNDNSSKETAPRKETAQLGKEPRRETTVIYGVDEGSNNKGEQSQSSSEAGPRIVTDLFAGLHAIVPINAPVKYKVMEPIRANVVNKVKIFTTKALPHRIH